MGIEEGIEEQVEDQSDESVEDQAEGAEEESAEEEPAPEGAGAGAGAETGAIQVTIGDDGVPEEEAKNAPSWVKKVRTQNRELQRELREARRKLNETAQTKESELGPRPTLETCDYDETKFVSSLEAYQERKRKVDEAAAAKKVEDEKGQNEYKNRLSEYAEGKTALGASDFADAESVVIDLLDTVQQGIIVSGAKNSALVVYALGKNEEKARELAAIKDPVKFAFAVANLEGSLKVTGRKPTTKPEERVSGNSRPSGATDSTLEKLRAEAEKTGNYTKVLEYKRQKASKRG
jgi:hypothetical protein